ncbi:MAG: hypothetical protein M0R47_17140 [Methylobacter sp.]|jgi:hypothetical protein|uniref:hypothetical protein n=1 Tax=Methylobacter sp. TaxID=2051955 RepID=UPI0025E8305C|nr:hypothetical protein [Methylobacter sp.]MCK9622250.1 hypothetical protein [Methylobacter sp.]
MSIKTRLDRLEQSTPKPQHNAILIVTDGDFVSEDEAITRWMAETGNPRPHPDQMVILIVPLEP